MDSVECGPGGNALSKLSKRIDTDLSLHQDRLNTGFGGHVGSNSLAHIRQRDGTSLQSMNKQFLYNNTLNAQPIASSSNGAYNFISVQQELQSIYPENSKTQIHPSIIPDTEWATEFQSNPHIHGALHSQQFKEFGELFAKANVAGSSWGAEFHHYQPARHEVQHHDLDQVWADPQIGQQFEEAFERAKESLAWEQEFTNPSNTNSAWEQEFASQQNDDQGSEIVVETETSSEAVAKTAGLLLDIVSKSTNPKFKQSKFVNFIQKLHQQEIAIEGSKVVDVVEPICTKGPKEWADDFLLLHGEKSTTPQSAAWEEEFYLGVPNFQGAAKLKNELFTNSNLANDIQDKSNNWADEFATDTNQTRQHISMADESTELMDNIDWAGQFNQHLQHHIQDGDNQDIMWDQHLNSAWSQQQPDSTHDSTILADTLLTPTSPFETYRFTPNNPYLQSSFSLLFLQSPDQHQNLAESIMALEAAVQRDPTHANTWMHLGQRQQENENDDMAICALLNCTRLDPSNLAAHLALSVSYTNEGYATEAYNALNTWISLNPLYEQFAGVPWSNSEGGSDRAMAASDRHTAVTEKFLAAASTVPGADLDEDVQIGLGVLFNISAEYDKAVDCFRAALVKRPKDYMLWNKLGASLANSHQPKLAMEAYFAALNINPSYIRSRYNMAIACLQIGQYRESAEHLLGALSVQHVNMDHVKKYAFDTDGNSVSDSQLKASLGPQSNTLWTTLRMLADTYLNRHDLVSICDRRDLVAFRNEFDF
ncbi:hypothetical protein O5D80_005845 [Batrachochytrium dendrobatidis]|nr:hypothetical protein O5D80_005845 [Batrachochytrium dendrobatidis]